MASTIYFENHMLSNIQSTDVSDLKSIISSQYGVHSDDLFVVINGKKAIDESSLLNSNNVVRIFTRLVGGKGGFGSMLRAIGAQIEKTTNREACRDLSGRRLRDINEEKRLRKWLEGQDEREREAVERKQKKLERLIAEPKIKVNLNPEYEKEREELPERVSAAVDAGWQAAGSSKEGTKRKIEDNQSKNKKKPKLWIDAELSDCSSLSEDEEEELKINTAQTVSTDSGNESDRVSECSKA
ncbi:replication stress response regulator SDE2 [Vanessa atalanta]|uniref:replication stress response regulator SDE2 n=1 Tax=Vanessa atalanta TaxID=42275 RepID=UPI001FCE0B7F|nr:replication stress response regulator SDE2 [Vanessa atalanta]